MSMRRDLARALALMLCVALVGAIPHAVEAGGRGSFFSTGAVGGVLIDAQGVVRNAEVADIGNIRKERMEALGQATGDVARPSNLRKISLRRLQEAIRNRRETAQSPLFTDEMDYLAGLTRIEYVLVYPEDNDIVLAGPAEGWKVGERGSVVGATSGRATLQLDHLLVALRTAEGATRRPISCSIDPTSEGLQRLQSFLNTQKTFNAGTVGGIEKSLGAQQVMLTGVPESSDFARVMVAADYRMKRLAMNFDASPVRGMGSYLAMIAGGAGGLQSMTPRWWMAPNYETMLRDKDGLVWQLRGQGVKVMTEDSFIEATGGKVQQSGRSSAAAQRWADQMTENFDEISRHYPIFGDLRNVMDMAVVGAVIVKENLVDKSGCDLTTLLDEKQISVEDYPAPKQIDTQASVVKKRGKYIISASGGVEISAWLVAQNSEESDKLNPLRGDCAPVGTTWWWD